MKPIILAILITILIILLYALNITKNTNDHWERKAKVPTISKVECDDKQREPIKDIFDCPALPADIEK